MTDKPCYLTVLTEQCVLPRPGISGGYASALNSFTVLRDGVRLQPGQFPGKISHFPLKRGDVLIEQSRGAPGWGDPLKREIERVRDDVELEYVSTRQAHDAYGVVIRDGEVDLQATRKLRADLEAARVKVEVTASDADEYDSIGRRICGLDIELAERMGVKHGDLLEYVPERGSHLKAWARIDGSLPNPSTNLGPKGRSILKVLPGERIWIRALLPSVSD